MSMRDVTVQDVQGLVFRKRDNGFEAAATQLRNLLKCIFDYAVVCEYPEFAEAHIAGSQLVLLATLGKASESWGRPSAAGSAGFGHSTCRCGAAEGFASLLVVLAGRLIVQP